MFPPPRQAGRCFVVTVPGLLMALYLGGCATSYRFKVDAVRTPLQVDEPESYRLLHANPETTENDPVFLMIAGHLRTALSSKGLFEAPPGTPVDVVVEVDYDIDQTGREVMGPWMDVTDPYGPKWETITLYEKFLRVAAREARPSGTRGVYRELWSVYVSNDDEGRDPEAYTLLLVSAAMDAIGEDVSGEREVVLSRDDTRVTFVAQGM